MTFKPLPFLTLASIASLIVLILLGNWQWEKFIGKSDQTLLQVESASRGVAVVVESPKGGEAVQVYGLIDGHSVWRRYVPGRINGVGDPVLVLVDATIGPEQIPLPIYGLGTVKIDGLSNVFVRNERRGFFTQRNDPQKNTWYWFDGTRMINGFGYSLLRSVRVVEREFVDLRDKSNFLGKRVARNPYFTPVTKDTLPSERHFGYALSWWGMAISLIIIYFAYHFQQGRLRVR